MSLTLQEVEHIAELARLKLSASEKERFREQLSGILEHVARLQEIDTADIPLTSSLLPGHSALRPDQVSPGLTPEELLRNAPLVEDNQFRVPPVLD